MILYDIFCFQSSLPVNKNGNNLSKNYEQFSHITWLENGNMTLIDRVTHHKKAKRKEERSNYYYYCLNKIKEMLF